MCGIFSLFNNNGSIPDTVINNSFKLGVSRGPEYSEYTNLYSSIVVGFHRLAINGLDTISHQPMTIDKVTLICNGEIYNFKKLFEMIEVEPHTNSDCEIIIHLYKRFGIEYTLTLLDGYFSFILYDASDITIEPVVYVARDTFGVRPLYIMRHRDNENSEYIREPVYTNDKHLTSYPIIAFASDLKMLSGLLNYNNKLLTHADFIQYTPANTFFIEQYPPGTYSILTRENKIRSDYVFHTYAKQYGSSYIFNSHIDFDQVGLNNYMYVFEKVYGALYEAVRKRVMGTTDRKIACLLSGGLDSSLVVALVSKFYDGELETYSIGMPGGEDLRYAKMVAEHIGSKHTEIILTEDQFFDAIPEVIYTIESYDTTTVRASVGNYLISKYISNNSYAKVIFNGDGSDELMGGYLYFHAAPDALSFDMETRRLLNDIHLFDVLRSDKSISSNGLEPRTPFLDLNWVNTYLSLPLKFRYNPNKPEKWLLRKSVEIMDDHLLPKEVLWRTKEAFSDGVSSNNKSWYQIITEKVNEKIPGDIPKDLYKHLAPQTKEQYYYRTLFDTAYPNCENVIPYFWMPRFINATDASARTLNIYKTHHKIENVNENSNFVSS